MYEMEIVTIYKKYISSTERLHMKMWHVVKLKIWDKCMTLNTYINQEQILIIYE